MHEDTRSPQQSPQQSPRESAREVTPLLPALPPLSDEEYQRATWIARMGRAHAAWQREWQRRHPATRQPRPR